jgi:hypothetical protein
MRDLSNHELQSIHVTGFDPTTSSVTSSVASTVAKTKAHTLRSGMPTSWKTGTTRANFGPCEQGNDNMSVFDSRICLAAVRQELDILIGISRTFTCHDASPVVAECREPVRAALS